MSAPGLIYFLTPVIIPICLSLSLSMSTPNAKRKRGPAKKAANKKGKRKEDSDVDSDMSDASGNENATQPDEVLIAGHGDALDHPSPLPKELLNTLIKPAGQLIFFGNINWDTIGKREIKGQKVLPNLTWPHRFTDLKVKLTTNILTVLELLDLLFHVYFLISVGPLCSQWLCCCPFRNCN